jgi:hypothetical protein
VAGRADDRLAVVSDNVTFFNLSDNVAVATSSYIDATNRIAALIVTSGGRSTHRQKRRDRLQRRVALTFRAWS